MSERVVVFDIELLNNDPASICSIGIIELIDHSIVSQYYSYIKPKCLDFDYYRYKVHQIKISKLQNKKTFQEVWEDISHYFKDSVVISHDIQNDMAHLRAALNQYHIPYPSLEMSCTYVLAHLLHPKLEKYNLADLADYYHISYTTLHNALEDARVCALILVGMLDESHRETLKELHEEYHLAFGEMKSNYYRNIISPDNANYLVKASNYEHPLFSKSVCFTGELDFPKDLLEQKTKNANGFTSSKVNTHTNYLVVGKRGYYKVRFNKKNQKICKALQLKKLGQDIKIIHEKQYISLLKKQ